MRAPGLYSYLETVSTDKYLSNKRAAQIDVLDFFWSNVLSLLIKEKFLFVIDTLKLFECSKASTEIARYSRLQKALVTLLEFALNVICRGMFSKKRSKLNRMKLFHRVI